MTVEEIQSIINKLTPVWMEKERERFFDSIKLTETKNRHFQDEMRRS